MENRAHQHPLETPRHFQANAIIDSSKLKREFINLNGGIENTPILLENFVHQISSSRFSSLFLNKSLNK
jgi:hypothetical protein